MTNFATSLPKYLLVAIPLLFAQLATPAHAQTKIEDCGIVITTPGNYVLAKDLHCPGYEDGIIIRSGGVEVGLGGHILSTDLGFPTRGIFVDGSTFSGKVQIHGPGLITGFDDGILVDSAHDVQVTGVSASGNGTGFATNLAGVVFRGNQAFQNVTNGFGLQASYMCELSDNTAFANQQDGFAIDGPINQISGNTAFANHHNGIATGSREGDKNQITKNHAMFNEGFDLFEGNSTCDNVWKDNTFGTANESCIH